MGALTETEARGNVFPSILLPASGLPHCTLSLFIRKTWFKARPLTKGNRSQWSLTSEGQFEQRKKVPRLYTAPQQT